MLRGTVLAVALVGCRGPAAGGAVVHAPGAVTATPVVVETQPAAPATAPVEAAPVEVPPVEPAAPVPPVVPAAPAQPVAVTVSFVLAPEVGPGPPTLAITVRNPSTQAVPLTRFADPACLVRHYLDLRVVRPNGRDQALAGCAVKDWPGTDESLAAGGEQRYVVPFAELAAKWPRGTYRVDVSWDPGELARARGEAAAVRASQSSLNLSEFTIARPLATVRVRRGATVTLPDGARLHFGGHGHKSVMAGQSSPLILRGSFTPPGKDRATEFSVNLHTEDTRVFRLAEVLVFELVDYEYDGWMRLRYFGRVAAPR
ncbi:MAG: hypothetical protein IPO88_02325 [Nannocystis sp.]|uniref:hypothetical protein n=1 Tax=Nannocystis sp. TaxID=1962667 RepID=UPI0024236091|nr:hypothetical protein [Nannocystis sp.]MBK9752339.1 hypothetical protein [Nannocystis sp.]